VEGIRHVGLHGPFVDSERFCDLLVRPA